MVPRSPVGRNAEAGPNIGAKGKERSVRFNPDSVSSVGTNLRSRAPDWGSTPRIGIGIMDSYRSTLVGVDLIDTLISHADNCVQASTVRYLAARLTLVIAEDLSMSRVIVFPQHFDEHRGSPSGRAEHKNCLQEETLRTQEDNTSDGRLLSSERLKKTLSIEVSSDGAEDDWTEIETDFQFEEWMEEASIDVRLRSWKGCIPLLWAMVRFGNPDGQVAAIEVLNKLTQNNTLVKEAIYCMDDIKSLVKVGRREDNLQVQRGLAQMLFELSKYPKVRKQLRRDGGLLLILQLNR